MSESFRGPLLWQVPVAKPMPRGLLVLIAFGLMAFSGVIVYFAERLISRMENPWSNSTAWIMIGSIAVFGLLGVWTLYCAIVYRVLQGTRFYLKGVEVGEGNERSFVPYEVLEILDVVVARAPDATDKTIDIARAAVSVVAMNPAGIGRALGKAMMEPIYSELRIKPRGRTPLSFPLSRAQHERLGPIFRSR